MTESDAAQIVAFLNAAYPRETLEEESIVVWMADVALLADAGTALAAAQQITHGSDRFPTIFEFRTTYRALAESKRQDTPAIPEPKIIGLPVWVHVWNYLRRIRDPQDWRALPQMREFTGDDPNIDLNEYADLEAEWRKNGSPKLGSLGGVPVTSQV